jgi:hypothetical protein
LQGCESIYEDTFNRTVWALRERATRPLLDGSETLFLERLQGNNILSESLMVGDCKDLPDTVYEADRLYLEAGDSIEDLDGRIGEKNATAFAECPPKGGYGELICLQGYEKDILAIVQETEEKNRVFVNAVRCIVAELQSNIWNCIGNNSTL